MANLRVNEITTGVGSYNGSIYATGTSSYLFTTVTAPGTDDFTIEFVTIATAGNGQDFGDLSFTGQNMMALSDSHGGLGGF